MTGHDCSSCTIATCNSRGTTTCPSHPAGKTPNQSIIQELKDEHRVMSVTVPCPCRDDVTGQTDPDCRGCAGTGKLMHGIDEVEFS